MGKVRTAIELRLKRARRILSEYGVQSNGSPGHFLVHSQTGDREYDVEVYVDPGTQWVMRTHCQCPDWRRMSRALEGWIEATGRSPHPGISHVDYSPVCKHALAVLLQMDVVE